MNVDVSTIVANIIFVVEHFAALGVLAIVSAAIGRRILGERFKFATRLESLSFSTALGLGAISFLILLIGELRVLYAPVLLIALFIAFLATFPVLRDWTREARTLLEDTPRVVRLIPIALILLGICMPFLVYALYPAKEWDTTQYHLAVAKVNVREHAIAFTPYLRYPVFPLTNQMLFTGALLVYDEQFAQQTQFLMLIVLCLAMAGFGARHLSSRAGWWGAGILLASPMIVFLGSIAYADIGLTLFCFLCCFAFWNWFETRSNAWILLSGAMGGLAFGSKYTGALFPLVFFLILLVTEWRKRNYRPAMLIALSSLVVASPWIVRNIYYAGNPVFPFLEGFFTSIFGHRYVDPQWFERQIGASLYIGIGRSLSSLLSLPWTMAVDNSVFLPEAPLTPIAAWMLPVTLVGAVLVVRIRWIFLLALGYTRFWFSGYQIVRYLLPVFPLYCLATAASVDWILVRRVRRGWVSHRLVTAAIFMLLLSPTSAKRRKGFSGQFIRNDDETLSGSDQERRLLASTCPKRSVPASRCSTPTRMAGRTCCSSTARAGPISRVHRTPPRVRPVRVS